MPKRSFAFLESLFVMVLWSSSPPLLKIALEDLTPVEIAGFRYFGAFLILLPILLLRSRDTLRGLSARHWLGLIVMGILAYTIGNIALITSLETLSATETAFSLNSIPLITLILGMLFLKEIPRRVQFLGFLLTILGAIIFFGPARITTVSNAIGLALLGSFALAIFGTMSRAYARSGIVDTVTLAAIPLGIGGGLLLVIAPTSYNNLNQSTVMTLLWLTVINTALAYLIWNHARKFLKAFESSTIVNLLPIGTALMAPLMIGESVPVHSWIGMMIALVGVILVGLR